MKSEIRENLKKPSLFLRSIGVGIIVLLIFGFMIDMFSGFYILRHSTSLYAGLAGLLLLSVFYLFGEAGAEWIHKKDEVTHPVHKRVFHLSLLLLYAVTIMATAGFLLNYFGLIKV